MDGASTSKFKWNLVEIKATPKPEYHVLHSARILGEYCGNYQKGKVDFIMGIDQKLGALHLASDDRRVVDEQHDLMVRRQNENIGPDMKPYLWCLTLQSTPEVVRLMTSSCKHLLNQPGACTSKSYLLKRGDQEVSVTLLHILESEQELLDVVAYMKDKFEHDYVNERDDHVMALGGLENAFFLVYYFEERTTLTFTIVRYRDIVWKSQNAYPDLVAYIFNGVDAVCQSVILRKSYSMQELKRVLLQIKQACERTVYPMMHMQLMALARGEG